MLNSLRKSLQGSFIKALLVLLVLTFILWGTGDMINGSNSDPYIFKVGDEEFTQEMWESVVKIQKEYMSKTYGYVSDEELKQSGYYQTLLQQLINKSILSQEARRLGILISDQMVKYQISTHPQFHDIHGKFSKEIFENALRQMGISEEQFVRSIKEEMSIQNLTYPFGSFTFPPPQMIEQINILANLERKIEVYEIDGDKITVNDSPQDQEIQELLNTHQEMFSTPETREVSYFTFDIGDVDQTVEVSEAELKSQYQAKIFLFTQPEKRVVHHLIFKEMDKALEAKKLLDNGQSLSEVGKKLQADNTETLIGTFTSEGFDKEIANAIFTIQKGAFSLPVETPMGVHIFQVTDIIPERVLSFDEAKPTLENQFKEEKLFERLSIYAQHIDNEIVNNRAIEDIAKQYNLKLSQSLMKDNQEASPQSITLEGSQNFKNTVFATDLGATSMVTPYHDETFFVLKVNKISPKRLRSLQEVKEDLVKFWREEQRLGLLEKFSGELYESLKQNQPIPDNIKQYLNIKNISLTKDMTNSLPQELIVRILPVEVGHITSPLRIKNLFLIAKLVALKLPDHEMLEKGKLEAQMLYSRAQPSVLLTQYLNELKKHYKIKINYALLDQDAL